MRRAPAEVRPEQVIKMKRRNFIALIGGAAVWPFTAGAKQTGKVPRVGYLTFRPSPTTVDDAFTQGMRELGWIEGKNILIERRYSGGNDDRLKELAAEIVRLEVDVIVAAATKCTQAAKDATSRIPIVFVGVVRARSPLTFPSSNRPASI
jgi:putative ABC transport system substrate-binding protein